MLYLVVLTYLRPLAEVDAQLAAHRAYLTEHYRAGHFLLSGPQDPRRGGVILARAESREIVETWVAQDPFHRAGVASYEIIGWQPLLRAAEVPECLAPAASVP